MLQSPGDICEVLYEHAKVQEDLQLLEMHSPYKLSINTARAGSLGEGLPPFLEKLQQAVLSNTDVALICCE